jgi:hypothetical protein
LPSELFIPALNDGAFRSILVKKAEATARTSRTPVLWTVPLRVMLVVVLMAPPYWALEMPPP